MKPGRASWDENFVGDGSSSHTGESSHTAFPELRQLRNDARLPIRKFLQKQISKFQSEKDVPRRMWLLAEAVKELDYDNDNDDDEDSEKEDPETEGAGGPFGTILHTACAVGNYWLVKLQIEAGVDAFALDQHSWTALMVATARGHTSSADLLSRHMKTSKVKATPQAFPPSGLAQVNPEKNALIGQDNLTVVLNSGDHTNISSNHPIPPHFKTYYYEIKVLSISRYWKCVHVSATKLLNTNSSFLVHAWV